MTCANIAALWALVVVIVATGWTHEQTFQDETTKPKYDAGSQVVAACASFMERAKPPTQ